MFIEGSRPWSACAADTTGRPLISSLSITPTAPVRFTFFWLPKPTTTTSLRACRLSVMVTSSEPVAGTLREVGSKPTYENCMRCPGAASMAKLPSISVVTARPLSRFLMLTPMSGSPSEPPVTEPFSVRAGVVALDEDVLFCRLLLTIMRFPSTLQVTFWPEKIAPMTFSTGTSESATLTLRSISTLSLSTMIEKSCRRCSRSTASRTVASLMWKSMPVAEAMAGHSIHRPVSIMAQMHRRRELSCMI